MSLNKINSDLENINFQEVVFKRWINYVLIERGIQFDDLYSDFGNGIQLVYLIETLTSHEFKSKIKNPTFRSQKLENITMVLRYLQDNVNIRNLNIDSSNILEKNSKYILCFIWHIIEYFSILVPLEFYFKHERIPMTKISVRQKILYWLNNHIYPEKAKNLTTDIQDGRIIKILTEKICKVSHNIDCTADGKVDIQEIFVTLNKMGFCELITDEEFITRAPDEKCIMVFLSQFIMYNNENAKQISPQLDEKLKSNVEMILEGLEMDVYYVNEVILFTVYSSDNDLISVRLTSPDGNKTCLKYVNSELYEDKMKLLYSVTPSQLGEYSIDAILKKNSKVIYEKYFNVCNQIKTYKDNSLDDLLFFCGRGIQPVGIRINDIVTFTVKILNTQEIYLEDINVNIYFKANESSVEITRQNLVDRAIFSYCPLQAGDININITVERLMYNRFFPVQVGEKYESQIVAFGHGLKRAYTNEPALFVVETNGETGTLNFTIEGPTEAPIECTDNSDGSATVWFWPKRSGEYAVHILYDEQDIPLSPFMVEVTDKNQNLNVEMIKVCGPAISERCVRLNEEAKFTIDMSNCKDLVDLLMVDCFNRLGELIEVNQKNDDGKIRISILAAKTSKLNICISLDYLSISNNPYMVYVMKNTLSNKLHVFGDGVTTAEADSENIFFIDYSNLPYTPIINELDGSKYSRENESENILDVFITDSNLNRIPYHIELTNPEEKIYTVFYFMNSNVTHCFIEILCNKISIFDKPFIIPVRVSQENEVFNEECNNANNYYADSTNFTVKEIFQDSQLIPISDEGKDISDFSDLFLDPNADSLLKLVAPLSSTPDISGLLPIDDLPLPPPEMIENGYCVDDDDYGFDDEDEKVLNYEEENEDFETFQERAMSMIQKKSSEILDFNTVGGNFSNNGGKLPPVLPLPPLYEESEDNMSSYRDSIRSASECYSSRASQQEDVNIPSRNLSRRSSSNNIAQAPSPRLFTPTNILPENLNDNHIMLQLPPMKPAAPIQENLDLFLLPDPPDSEMYCNTKIIEYSEIIPIEWNWNYENNLVANLDIQFLFFTPNIRDKYSKPNIYKFYLFSFDVKLSQQIYQKMQFNQSVKQVTQKTVDVLFSSTITKPHRRIVTNDVYGISDFSYSDLSMTELLPVTQMDAIVSPVDCCSENSDQYMLPPPNNNFVTSKDSIIDAIPAESNFTDLIPMETLDTINSATTMNVKELRINGTSYNHRIKKEMTMSEVSEISDTSQWISNDDRNTTTYFQEPPNDDLSFTLNSNSDMIMPNLFNNNMNTTFSLQTIDSRIANRDTNNCKFESLMHSFPQKYTPGVYDTSECDFLSDSFPLPPMESNLFLPVAKKNVSYCDLRVCNGVFQKSELPAAYKYLCTIPICESAKALVYPVYNNKNYLLNIAKPTLMTSYDSLTEITQLYKVKMTSSQLQENFNESIHMHDQKIFDGLQNYSFNNVLNKKRSKSMELNTSQIAQDVTKVPQFSEVVKSHHKRSYSQTNETSLMNKELHDKYVKATTMKYSSSDMSLPENKCKSTVTENESQGKLEWNIDSMSNGNIKDAVSIKSNHSSRNSLIGKLNVERDNESDVEKINDGIQPLLNLNGSMTIFGDGIHNAIAGEFAEFFIQTNGAEIEGINLSIKGPSKVDIQTSNMTNGDCCVKYVANIPGQYTLTIQLYDQHVAGSPFLINVKKNEETRSIRTSNSCIMRHVYAEGSGLTDALINYPNTFFIYTKQAGPGGLSLSIEGPSKAIIEFKDAKNGVCGVLYRVNEPGLYTCIIKFNKKHIKGSPFNVNVKAIHSPPVKDLNTSDPVETKLIYQCGIKSVFKISSQDLNEIYKSIPEKLIGILIGPSGSRCNLTVCLDFIKSVLWAEFTPNEVGVNTITFIDENNSGWDKSFNILVEEKIVKSAVNLSEFQSELESIHVYGKGLINGISGQVNVFFIEIGESVSGALNVTVDGPSKVEIKCSESDKGFKFSYLPSVSGEYTVTIKYGGETQILGSPFYVRISNASCTNNASSKKHHHHYHRRDRRKTTSSHSPVSYSSKTDYSSAVVPAPNSNCDAAILCGTNVVFCYGVGLRFAKVGMWTGFYVDASSAKLNHLFVSLIGPTQPCQEIRITHTNKQRFLVYYKPKEHGNHVLVVKWADSHATGSPTVILVDSNKV